MDNPNNQKNKKDTPKGVPISILFWCIQRMRYTAWRESKAKTTDCCFCWSDVPRCEQNKASVPSRSYATQKWTGRDCAERQKRDRHPLWSAYLFFGDPYGNRTNVSALRGPRLSRLTNGPLVDCSTSILLFSRFVKRFCKSFSGKICFFPFFVFSWLFFSFSWRFGLIFL